MGNKTAAKTGMIKNELDREREKHRENIRKFLEKKKNSVIENIKLT